MRVSSVVGLSPSRWAAPPAPRIRQPALSSTPRMCSRVTSVSVALRWRAPAGAAGRAMVRRGPVATTIARSTTFRSSRMFPGQPYRWSADMFSSVMTSIALAEPLREFLDEAPHQERNVLEPVPKRRHVDRKDVQSVEQILAKRSRRRCPFSRSRCVAAMTRVSTRIARGLPSRSNCRSSSTRSSFTWVSAGRSPISSRKIVEWCASSNLPICRSTAPV